MVELVSRQVKFMAGVTPEQSAKQRLVGTAALRASGSLAISLLLALLTVVATEFLVRGSLTGVPDFLLSTSRPGGVTVALLFLLFIGSDALMGRAHQSCLILIAVALMLAFLSMQKQQYLSDPLYPSDMLFGRQIGKLMPVIFATRPFAVIGVAAALVAFLAALCYLLLSGRHLFRPLSRRGRLLRLAVAVPLIGGFLPLTQSNSFTYIRDRLNIMPKMWDQAANYRHNGFLLAFAFNAPMANVKAPGGYGETAIANIPLDQVPAGLMAAGDVDVIMVMSESLWDPTRLTNVTLSPDPIPTIRTNQSGDIFSPEFGGMTPNVEFEALTGFSNAFLPYGSIPYQQYVRHPLPSLATFFGSKHYVTRAFHPFQAWFWNRGNVYQQLGFDSFDSQETLPPLDKRGKFASDESLTREIIRNAEAEERPFFYFAVTLQGHGPYEKNRYANNSIVVSSNALTAKSRDSLATYAQGVREADDSLKALMDWARQRPRETVIVLFGDHLPPLGSVYTQTGYMPTVVATRKASAEVMKKEHETPLVVWSSRRGVQKDLGSISPALLPHYVVELAGYSHPFYTSVLGALKERYAIIDRHQLIDRDDRPQADWAKSGAPLDPLIRDYRYLQHDQMFGDSFGTERFFPEQLGRDGTS